MIPRGGSIPGIGFGVKFSAVDFSSDFPKIL